MAEGDGAMESGEEEEKAEKDLVLVFNHMNQELFATFKSVCVPLSLAPE